MRYLKSGRAQDRPLFCSIDTQDKKHYTICMTRKIIYPEKKVKRSLTVRLPLPLLEELRRLAVRRKVSMALLVQIGLEFLFESEKEHAKLSA